MPQLTPRLKREATSDYHQLCKDEHKTVAAKIIGDKYGVSAESIFRWGQKSDRSVVPQTSGDYEIRASVPRASPQPAENILFDEKGRYDLTKRERWLILPDTQIPHHDHRSLNAVLEYAKTQYYDGCIQLGDFMDWDFCSRWTADNARKAEGQRFLEEYINGNEVLDQIQQAARTQNPDAHLIVIEGNHDWRIQAVIDKTPALAGMIDVEKNLRFAERNAHYWRYWVHKKPIIIGCAYFIHGDYIGSITQRKPPTAIIATCFMDTRTRSKPIRKQLSQRTVFSAGVWERYRSLILNIWANVHRLGCSVSVSFSLNRVESLTTTLRT